jgi:hypothetical protein
MSDKYILDDDGRPVPCDDLEAWAYWFETAERHVADDMDEGEGAARVRVSTVFLGLDHSWGHGPPVLWESMIFGGPLDGEQQRYSSREEALLGHHAMCLRASQASQS